MKQRLLYLKNKMKRLSPFWWRVLILLTLGVLLKGWIIIGWDVAATSLLIDHNNLHALGANFIGGALLLSLFGVSIWKLDRQKGNAATFLTGVCLLLASSSLTLWEFTGNKTIINFIFILKYVFYFVWTLSFWAISRRFVKEQFTSLKFLSLFCLELFSFSLAGILIITLSLNPMTILISSVFAIIGLMLVFKTLTDMSPVPKDSFIKKTDGMQDVFERPLVLGILALSFFGMLARVLTEGILYEKIAETGVMPTVVLGLVWALFGALALFMVLVLYHTRYMYTTLAGMIVFGGSVIYTGIMALGQHSGTVATGYLMLLLCSHFYLNGYLKLLPRVLSGGNGPRLKKRIYMMTYPLAFILCGSVCLNLSEKEQAYCLIGIGAVLIILTFRTAFLYTQVLFRMLEMRLWRQGPILIAYKRLALYLSRLVKQKNPDDVIYALRMLQSANHPLYETTLTDSLTHPLAEVRLYALRKIRKIYRFETLFPRFEKSFKKEDNLTVKQALLTNLILTSDKPEKYLFYLKDKKLRAGAIMGFLKLGKDFSRPATEALNNLCQSQLIQDNLSALDIISVYPKATWIPFVERMIKHPNQAVVCQALLTAGRLKSPILIPMILRALDDPNLQETALTALKTAQKSVFPPIEKMISSPTTPTLRRKQLILFLGSSESGEGKQILMRMLSIENQKLKKTIVQNILDSGIVWIHPNKKNLLLNNLKRDVERISWLLHLHEVFSTAPTHEAEESFDFFLRAIQEDITDTRELILYQLLLLENNDIFARAIRILLSDSYELYLPAIGMVQDLVSGRLYQKLKPILLLPLAQKRKEPLIGLSVEDAVKELATVLINPPYALNHWIRTTALYALRRLGSPSGIPIAESSLSDTNSVVLEAAIWTLVRLQPDKEKLHQKLLTIPTTRLSELSLDKLLDS